MFSYLADPMHWHDFAPAVEFRKQIDAGPPRVGTRWMATDRIGPFRIQFIDRLEILAQDFRRLDRLLTLEARQAGRWHRGRGS